MRKLIWALALVAPGVQAAEAGLPAEADVRAALDGAPGVAAAQARAEAASDEARALARGPHEFTLSATYASRTVNDGTGVANGRFNEYSAELTRPFRLPGKAGLDRQIGAAGVTYARNMAEDARHQTALRLAQLWWDWVGAATLARIDRQASDNARALLASVERRAALRDASRLEVDQASAALGAAAAEAERSAGRQAVARARLATQFPQVLPATPPETPAPQLPPAGLMRLQARILGASHELAAATAAAQRADAQAERARRERVGDPTFGLRVFSDKGGMEKGAGLVFSMPLGGGARSALASKAAADAVAAQADLQATRRDIAETAAADVAEAEASTQAWSSARAALDAQVAALAKTRRGQQLGEISLAEVLLAERMTHAAFRAEAEARTEAVRALTRLRIDAHELWIGDADEAPAG